MSGNKDKDKQKVSSSKGGRSAKSVSFSGRSESGGSSSQGAQAGSSRASSGLHAQGVNSNRGRGLAASIHPPLGAGHGHERRQLVAGPGHSHSVGVSSISGSGSAVVRKEVSSSETDSFDDSANGPLHILDLPESVLENIFTFLSLKDIPTAAMVCPHFRDIISDENCEVWRSSCSRELNSEVTHSELLASLPTFKAKLRAFHHAWNPHDCSRNIFVKTNGFTIHRNPVAQSTDAVRGKIGFSEGRHAWEVVWEGPLGTVAVVGVASRRADMRAQGYIALLGQDEHSWGWNLVDNSLLHNGDSQGHYPLINNAPRYQVGERIRVILDCEDSTLAFEKDYEFLGVAFRGLPTHELLFPSISAVYGNTEVSMVYLGPPLDG